MAKTKYKYPATEIVMEDWGILITDKMVELLSRKHKNASGSLSASIDFEVESYKEGIRLDIVYSDYGPIIKGRGNVLRGRRSGQKQPPINEIIKWIRDKKIPVRIGNEKTGKKTGKTKKLSKFGQEKSLAYVIARSIARDGIKPFNFLLPYEEAVESGDMRKDIRLALVKDGYSNISPIIAEFNKKQK